MVESALTQAAVGSRAGTVRRIAVAPADELDRRRSLFAALAAVLPVHFEGARAGGAADAVVAFDALPDTGRAPTLLLRSSSAAAASGPREVVFAAAPALDARLRGRTLVDAESPSPAELALEPGDEVLAACEGQPVWARRERAALELAALAPPELAPDEVLRDRLKAGSFLSLLPLLHFLREVSADIGWRPPPMRAQIMFDDPNLHWRSYGHVAFRALADHASAAGYHVSFAMVPLDAFFAAGGAVRAFDRARGALSLLIHGNNHTVEELLAKRSPSQIERLAAQALRRIARFERRTGLHVDRVMCPPHGVCSEATMHAMLRLGYEAICANWPFPWPPGRPPAGWLAAGWEGAQFLAGAFPVIPRSPIYEALDDVVFRALLDQPLIVYGHEGDLAGGPDALAPVVDLVNSLGDVRWCSSERIARTNFLTRRNGRRLVVRMLSRRVELDVPDGVDELVVSFPGVHGDGDGLLVRAGATAAAVDLGRTPVETRPIPVRSGRLEVSVGVEHPLDPVAVPPSRTPPRAVVRRIASEARDRLMPVVTRLRKETA